MKFEALASSSSGNAYIVSDRDTRILLECGIPHKKLQKLSGFSLSEFKACLVTHEHKDHAKSVQELISSGMDVYMSYGTAQALGCINLVKLIEHMEQFNIGSFDCVAFNVFHDTSEPLGFLIKSRVDGDIFAFATDTVNLRYKFPGLNILAIEANYSPEILAKNEKMPEKVKHRIENTHMNIDVLCDYLSTMDLSQCREIYLLHLSDSSSHEKKFISKVKNVIPPHINVTVCPKEAKSNAK
jgi:phosphoribosyl 1,2-cyclic phosphodiesterase